MLQHKVLSFSSKFFVIKHTVPRASYCSGANVGEGSGAGGGGSNDTSSPKSGSFYDVRKYGHNLPTDTVKPRFEALPGIPCGIFRCTGGEILGRGADKCCLYKNPEYFSFHHMTFFDLHLYLRPCRQPSPVTGRKK